MAGMNQVAFHVTPDNQELGGDHVYLIVGPRIPGGKPINVMKAFSVRVLNFRLKRDWPDAVVIAEIPYTKELLDWVNQFTGVGAPAYKHRDALAEAKSTKE
jgi:hypothetical protein